MFLSVIICTRNRSAELLNSLSCLVDQVELFPDVEVVVVDNGSTDNTRKVVETVSGAISDRFIYVYEAEPGLCLARNRGRKVARGQILAYIDDDVLIGDSWIKMICDHFHAGISDCLAGKVEIASEKKMPDWLSADLHWILGKTLMGDDKKFICYPLHPQGNNFAMKRDVFDLVGGFDPRFTLYGDETDFFRRASSHNITVYYDPSIVVIQTIPERRLTQIELGRKAYKWGRGAAMVQMLTADCRNSYIEAVRYLMRASYVGLTWLIKPDFGRYFTFWHYLGYCRQLIAGT